MNKGKLSVSTTRDSGLMIMNQLNRTLLNGFSKLNKLLNELPDHRKRRDYSTTELTMAGISMFLFRECSRNGFNNDRVEANFASNYQKVFKLRLPHMDTVEDFFRKLSHKSMENIKASLFADLVRKKVFSYHRLLGQYYLVVIDGTGLFSYKQNNAEGTRIFRESKNGKVTYHDYVLEAKMVTTTGLVISIASEWVSNEGKSAFEKQDCELKAFVRLAQRIKSQFPQLPICISADGLYPNETFMKTCKGHGWEFLVVLKDEQLKTLHEDITDIEDRLREAEEVVKVGDKGRTHITQKLQWIREDAKLEYHGHRVFYLKCKETVTKYDKAVNIVRGHKANDTRDKAVKKSEETTNFEWLCSIPITNENKCELEKSGRNRWKIENEGFNTQKNLGYSLGHKFARVSKESMMNFYECLQIAHFISQLVEHSTTITKELCTNTKQTIIHFWKQAKSWLTQKDNIDSLDLTERRTQLRLRK